MRTFVFLKKDKSESQENRHRKNMAKLDLKGLGVALITPFTENKSVDYDKITQLVNFLISGGVDYIVTLGTTAETPTLSSEEKQQVIHTVVKAVDRRVPIVVGIGCNNTAEVIRQLQTTDLSGADAILSVAPYYNKPSQEGLFQHFCAVSAASPLPILLYNIPGRTGVNLLPDTVIRIAQACPNVVGVKEASGNIEQIRAIIEKAPKDFQVISGDDAMAPAVIESGGVGVISVFGNAFPTEMKKMVDCALAGKKTDDAYQQFADFDSLCRLLFVDGNPAGVKCVMAHRGFIQNQLRLPLVPVRLETENEIIKELKNFRYE